MDEIIGRAVRGDANAEELQRLTAWRAAAPENERQYRATASILHSLRSAAQHPHVAPPPAAELLERMGRRHAHRRTRRGPRVWLPWGLAAAATIALAVNLTTRVRSNASPALAELATQPAEIVTGDGELATVRMPDGSVARVAPHSRLRLMHTRRERTVWVEGRAFFAVARDSSRPFRVRTVEGDLVALGTRFDVRTDRQGLRLAVLEGRVALFARGERTEVSTGESADVRGGRTSPVVKFGDPHEVTRWMRRFLAFQSTPLQHVASEIEQVYGRRVVIADPSLAGETVTATFTDLALEQVIRVVCTVVGVQCDVTDAQVTIGR